MFIKRPGKIRRTYSIVGKDGLILHDPRIDLVNKDLRAGVPADELEARLRKILQEHRPASLPVSHTNYRLVADIVADKLRRKPFRVRPDLHRSALLRAAKVLGPRSIYTVSEEELLTSLAPYSPAARWHIARALNEMLSYLKRGWKLYNPPPPLPNEIAFVRVKDFFPLISPLDPLTQCVLGSLLATGCRWSELPLAELGSHSVYVRLQLRTIEIKGPTKNGKHRRGPLLPPLSELVERYRKLSPRDKAQVWGRREWYYKAWKRVSGMRIHDLRHSYAVELRSIGVETSAIAEYIGDTPEVCRRHYLNYCATDEEMDRVRRLWKDVP